MIDVNGPTYAWTILAPCPMMAGPRIVERSTTAPGSMTTLPSIRLSRVHGSLDAALERVENQSIRFEHVLQLAGVLPPALDDVRAHGEALVDQVLNGVGDLQLVAKAWLDPIDGVEDLRSEHVDADERQVADPLLRLFHQTDDLPVAKLRDTEHLRVRHLGQQNLCRWSLAAELLDEVSDALVEQVVAQVHHERIVADEVLADLDSVGQAAWRILLDIGDAHAPPRAVAHGGTNLRVRVADDDPDVRMPASAIASIP